MPAVSVADTRDDSRLWLLGANRVPLKLLLHWKDLSVELGLFGAGTLTATIHKDQFAGLSNGGDDVLATDFGWTGTQGLCSLDYYHRGTLVFSGPVQTPNYNRDGQEGNAWVTLTAETWGPALLRRRQVRTSGGLPWTDSSESWHDIGIKLIAEQCKNGTVVTPTGWQQNAETRDDFGAFTVTTAAETGSGSETYTVAERTNLWDAVTELCNTPASTDDKMWPTWTESPAGTFTFNLLVGRSGGGRAIGSDVSGTVAFATPRRGVQRFEMTYDGAGTGNHLVAGGKGAGQGQLKRHVADDTSITTRNLGVYEDVADNLNARTNEELDSELRRALFERKTPVTWTAQIVETTGNVWPADFDVADTITVYDEFYPKTVTNMIIGVRLSYPAPGPYTLELMFGQPPRNETRDIARSSGGGGGGRGGGGRNKGKDGSRYLYDHVVCNTGINTAHETSTGLSVIGETTTRVRATTVGTDATADGSDDECKIYVIGDFTAGPLTPNGWVGLSDGAGGVIKLEAQFP